MIIKILDPAGSNFPGVQYNDKKIEKGSGELMLMENFPSFITESSSKDEVRDYFKLISKSDKVKKPQFHAVISGRYKEESKEELTRVAQEFMNEMGYGSQPFIIVYHGDTENNHVHIVSTRVDKTSGKKINDSFEKLKAQKALAKVLEKKANQSYTEKIDKILQYKVSNMAQMQKILERNGFTLSAGFDKGTYNILKNGVFERKITESDLLIATKNDARVKQLRAVFHKYKNELSTNVFKVEDYRHLEDKTTNFNPDWIPKVEFQSELQHFLREKFGIDIVFSHKDNHNPFGFVVIDNKTKSVFKGSEIMKMGGLFKFTDEVIDKKDFERIKDYNFSDDAEKATLINYLKKTIKNDLKEFMVFSDKKKKNKDAYNSIREDTRTFLKKPLNGDIKIMKDAEGNYKLIHAKYHFIGNLQDLVDKESYRAFVSGGMSFLEDATNKILSITKELIVDISSEFLKSSGNPRSDDEDENRKRRKRRK